MSTKSPWWIFLLVFFVLIGGIQSLGWWAKPVSAAAQATQVDASPATEAAARRNASCQPMHWRAIVMCQ